jgi:uncharacterized protein (TIGR02001 family)
MKKASLIRVGFFLLFLITSSQVFSQEGKKSLFTINADIYSNYVWRGTKFGTGPHIQPGVKFSTGGFTAGVWGSFDANGYSETDPYLTYIFPFGLSLGVTDYYYPGLQLSDVSTVNGSHALEINGGYSLKGISLGANYIVNEAGGAGSKGSDLYFQAGYSFSNVSLFAGCGNGWHTSDGDFEVCNIGMSVTKTISITEHLSIPLIGQVIINPDKEQLFLVAGFSF